MGFLIMFHRDFYPTPVDTIKMLFADLELEKKTVLDPSCGKADILKYAKQRGSKVIGCEVNEELYKISNSYAEMIGRDFLELEKTALSHVDYIIMNPPFSADIKHILHAWEVLPDGGELRALCNADTLYNTNSFCVRRLKAIIHEYGYSKAIGQPFTTAERTTRVNVAMINLSKPQKEQTNWDEYFEYEEIDEHHSEGIMTHDAITEIVGRYVGALKMYKRVEDMNSEINSLISPINMSSIYFGCTMRDYGRGGMTEQLSFETFKVSLQKSAWKTVFRKMNMEKYMTENLKEKINKFVEEQSNTPFTRRNIYNMLQFIYSTNKDRMDEVLVEVFDVLTEYYDENRMFVEGWKTNSHYMVNRKVILPYMIQRKYGGGMDIDYRNARKIDDLAKALCYITGKDYDEVGCLEGWLTKTKITDESYYRGNENIKDAARRKYKHYLNDWRLTEKFTAKYPTEDIFVQAQIEEAVEKCPDYYRRDFGKWYDWGFFEIKGFKKGTMHLKFKDERVWELFNQRIAEIKGFPLPQTV